MLLVFVLEAMEKTKSDPHQTEQLGRLKAYLGRKRR